MPAFPDCVAAVAPRAHRRLVAALMTVALVVAMLAAPRFGSVAAAASPHARSASTAPAHGSAQAYARAMLRLLNRERSHHHLRALTMNSKLISSAHTHNKRMARTNTMSHQLPGEKPFTQRIDAVHYKWRSVGENIGWTSRWARSALLDLQRQMYGENAPDNGHRKNILDHSFRDIGIDVYFDSAHHKMWFTQDFGQPA